jgi:dTDP-4-dehydrorhamnose 3,5-epimerase-like enzyme
MPLQLESAHLGGDVVVIVPKVLGDDRGFFMETYRSDNFRDRACRPSGCRTITLVQRRECCEVYTSSGSRP